MTTGTWDTVEHNREVVIDGRIFIIFLNYQEIASYVYIWSMRENARLKENLIVFRVVV